MLFYFQLQQKNQVSDLILQFEHALIHHSANEDMILTEPLLKYALFERLRFKIIKMKVLSADLLPVGAFKPTLKSILLNFGAYCFLQ